MRVALPALPLGPGAMRPLDLSGRHGSAREPAISGALMSRGTREVLRNMLGSGVVGYGGCKSMGWECGPCLPKRRPCCRPRVGSAAPMARLANLVVGSEGASRLTT